MNFYAVIGLGFGDEGKGSIVDWLSSKLFNSIVIRYCGGQQASHTVVKDRMRHVFSNFGSGTLRDIPTYWSKYCTVDPRGIFNEYNILKNNNIIPKLYIDKECPITTIYDKQFNLSHGMTHGSCGVGVGTTIRREENYYHFTMNDIVQDQIKTIKLSLIKEFYTPIFCKHHIEPSEEDELLDKINFINDSVDIIATDLNKINTGIDNYIFESSQGLLLDQNYGFFPYVSRGNTGTKNIIDIIHDNFSIHNTCIELYLVTRAYQTRHGIGPMTNENKKDGIVIPYTETNLFNDRQGKFRYSILDLDLIQYAMDCDPYIRKSKNKNLVITCCDHLKRYRLVFNKTIFEYKNKNEFLQAIKYFLDIKNLYFNTSPEAKTIQKF